MRPPTNCRWLNRQDVAAVWRVVRRREPPEPSWSRQHLDDFLASSLCSGLLAERADEVVGLLLYRLRLEDTTLVLTRLDTLPRCRRQGIGSRLLALVWQHIRSVPHTRIEALVGESNLPAQLFLRANGFRAIRICHAAFTGGEEAGYLFEKRKEE